MFIGLRDAVVHVRLGMYFISYFFFHWFSIPERQLTSSVSFRHFSLGCALSLQCRRPNLATSTSNSSHRLNSGLPLFLSPLPPGSVQRTFFVRSLFISNLELLIFCNYIWRMSCFRIFFFFIWFGTWPDLHKEVDTTEIWTGLVA